MMSNGAVTPDKIAGVKVQLVLTDRLDERWDLFLAMGETDGKTGPVTRVLAAALALCWPQLREWLGEQGIACKGGRVDDFGGDVIHFLLNLERPERALPGWEKPDLPAISRAGRAAYNLVRDGLIGEKEVADAEGFSGAPVADSPGSSSTSSATGAATLDGSGPCPPPPPRS